LQISPGTVREALSRRRIFTDTTIVDGRPSLFVPSRRNVGERARQQFVSSAQAINRTARSI
jgi:hypothetical protein